MHIKSGALYSESPNCPGARLQALAYLHIAVSSDHRRALLSIQSQTSFFSDVFSWDPLNTRILNRVQLHDSFHGAPVPYRMPPKLPVCHARLSALDRLSQRNEIQILRKSPSYGKGVLGGLGAAYWAILMKKGLFWSAFWGSVDVDHECSKSAA